MLLAVGCRDTQAFVLSTDRAVGYRTEHERLDGIDRGFGAAYVGGTRGLYHGAWYERAISGCAD